MTAIQPLFLFTLLFITQAECEDFVVLFSTRKSTLRDVGYVNLSSAFNDLVKKYFEKALKLPGVTTSSVAVPPDISILSNAWFHGTPAQATSSVAALNKIFDGWSTQPDVELVWNLNELCLKEFGRQPRNVEFAGDCEYDKENVSRTSSDFGFNNLTLSIVMQKPPSKNLVKQLCSVLSVQDCSLITLERSSIGNVLHTAIVTVTTSDRSKILLELLDHLRYASLLLTEQIVSIRINGVRVYVLQDAPELTYEGDVASCAGQYWYLIFLILLFPLILLVSSRLYALGSVSGKKAVRSMEWDIRSGVRYQGSVDSQMPQTAFSGLHPANQYVTQEGAPFTGYYNQGRRMSSQQSQNIYYDPNNSWQYGGANQDTQYYPVTRQTQ